MITKELLSEWHQCKKTLDRSKRREMQLRKQIVADLMGTAQKERRTVELFGLELQAETKITFSIPDKDALLNYLKTATIEEQECVKLTPSIVLSKYEKLPASSTIKKDFVEVKPAAPALKIISILEDS